MIYRFIYFFFLYFFSIIIFLQVTQADLCSKFTSLPNNTRKRQKLIRKPHGRKEIKYQPLNVYVLRTLGDLYCG